MNRHTGTYQFLRIMFKLLAAVVVASKSDSRRTGIPKCCGTKLVDPDSLKRREKTDTSRNPGIYAKMGREKPCPVPARVS